MYVPVLLSQGKPPENPGTAAVGLSSKMWELMQSCWEVDPAVRPDMDKIQLAMRDILPRVELRSNVIARRPSTSPAQNQPLLPTLFPTTINGSSSHESSRSSFESSFIPAPLTPPPTNTGLQLTLEPSTMTPTLSRLGEIEAVGTLKRGGYASSLTSVRLPTLREDDHDTHTSGMPMPLSAPSLSAPSQTSLFSHLPSPPPSAAPSLSPRPPLASLQRHTSMDSSSSRSSTSTGESAPRPPARKLSRWLPFPQRRSQTTTPGPGDPVTVIEKPPKPPRSRTTPAGTSNVVPQRSATILAPTRQWVPVSHEVLGFLERVASDPEGFLRPAKDGSVSAGNLEGLFSRVIAGSADPFRDERLKAAFLTIYQLFATSERLFEVINRRFESTSLDPSMARSRY
jgi:hypothetical protein